VTGPFGYLLGLGACLEPRRDAGMPQVIGPFGQRGGCLFTMYERSFEMAWGESYPYSPTS
jgi:hypothetical protein